MVGLFVYLIYSLNQEKANVCMNEYLLQKWWSLLKYGHAQIRDSSVKVHNKIILLNMNRRYSFSGERKFQKTVVDKQVMGRTEGYNLCIPRTRLKGKQYEW